MARLLALLFVVLALLSSAHAAPIRSLLQGKKNVPVPCVMKYFNGFCYTERKADACTFYSSPSYATYKECAASTNMGKTLKCAEVPKDQQGGSMGSYADCLDAEPTAAGAKAPAAAAPAPAASGSSGYAKGVVPCVMKNFNSFCYIERKAETCNFYSSPSYATYKDCAASTNMGKTLKCAEVPKDQRTGTYADCLDAEPTAAQKAGTKAAAAAAPAPAASGSSGYAKGVVPCVMKNFNSFCYIERKAETCNFYSSPSYATYKDCAASTNMGKTLKCAEVPKDQRTGTYADCLDAEPTAAQKAGAAPVAAKWSQRANSDIKGLDIACNGKAFCEICGKSLADVQKQCAATAGCKSITTDKKCFYLKKSGGAANDVVVRSGFDVWVLGA